MKMELPCKQNEMRVTSCFQSPICGALKSFLSLHKLKCTGKKKSLFIFICLQSAPIKITLNTPMNSTSDTVGTPSARDRCKADSFSNLLGNFSEETMRREGRKDHSLI